MYNNYMNTLFDRDDMMPYNQGGGMMNQQPMQMMNQPSMQMMNHQPMGPTQKQKVGEVYLHVVVQGDNLYALARSYETTIDLIKAMNSIEESAILSIGQQLYIPVLYKQMPVNQEIERLPYGLYF